MLHHRKMPFRRLASILSVGVMTMAVLAGCGAGNGMPGAGKGETIATYEGGKVTDKEFDKYGAVMMILDQQTAMYLAIPQFKEELVKQYIVSTKLGEQASAADKKAVDEESKQFKTWLEDQVKNSEQLKTHMKDSGVSVADAVKFFKAMSAFEKFGVAKQAELKAAVTDDEMHEEYDKAPADFSVATLRHILIGVTDPTTGAELMSDEDALAKANEVKTKLDANGDWAALAPEYSTDPGSKDNGGLYENYKSYKWATEFKDAVNTQAVGANGEPVRTQYGYHVIKVESRTETPFDQLNDEDKDYLKTIISNTETQEFITAERDKLNIVVTLPEEPLPSASGEASESPSASPSASAQ